MNRYLHDHDEELGMHWYGNPLPDTSTEAASTRALLDSLPARLREPAYWVQTGRLVKEYLQLQAGADYSETLRQGFVAWLKGSRAERQRYVSGDDMQRAALVDWYLKVVR
jgi:hypothetical protein